MPIQPNGSRRLIVAITVIAIAGAAYWLLTRPSEPVPRRGETRIPVEQLLAPSTPAPAPQTSDYVGISVCAECHAERVDEFRATNHFRTSRLPVPAEIDSLLAGATGVFQTRDPRLRFEMRKEGEHLIQSAVMQSDSSPLRRSERVELIYGAGGVDEIHMYWKADRLFQLPVAYLHPLQQWGNAPGYIDGTVNFDRPVPPRCLECHATYVEHHRGTDNGYRRDNLVLGVSCERCHGPGRGHAEFHRTHPDAVEARKIVHPGTLEREQQLAICSQCHSNAAKPKTGAFEYRPGLSLEDYYRDDLKSLPETSHTANQIEALRLSQCFLNSPKLTCTTCHDPHVPEGPGNSASAVRSCLQCHAPEACRERESLPLEVRERCIDCHMPVRRAANISFDLADDEYVPLIERREHRVGIHETAQQELLLEWRRNQTGDEHREIADQLARELADRYRAEGDALRAEFRFEAAAGAYREVCRLDPDPENLVRLEQALGTTRTLHATLREAEILVQQQRLVEAIDRYRSALALHPRQAEAHGRLGTLLVNDGRREEGIAHLKLVAEYDPDNSYGDAMLGWIHYLERDFTTSDQHYRQAHEREPWSAQLHYQHGLVRLGMNDRQGAEEHWNQTLEIHPAHSEAAIALCELLRQAGRHDEAIEWGKLAARSTSARDPEILAALAQAFADGGRFEYALSAIDVAQAAAPLNQPRLWARLRELREEFARRAGLEPHAANRP